MATGVFASCTFVFAELREFSKSHRKRFIAKAREHGANAYDACDYDKVRNRCCLAVDLD
jgi:hypothetical protein